MGVRIGEVAQVRVGLRVRINVVEGCNFLGV